MTAAARAESGLMQNPDMSESAESTVSDSPVSEPAAAEPAAPQPPRPASSARIAAPSPVVTNAPLPPERPLDLGGMTALPAPPPAVAALPPDDDEREWPVNPNAATPVPDVNIESPDEPGTRFIATDPGISALCLPDVLKEIVQKVAARFGEIKITSTRRAPGHNRRIGGRRESYHLSCEAVDFRVSQASPRTVYAFVRDLPETGGHKIYWNGIIHVDVGPRRSW